MKDKPKLKVLHIGIKNYPMSSGLNSQDLKGIRGGGMNKYCDILISSLPNNIHPIIITQRLSGEKKFQIINNVHVYRVRTFGNRAIRQIVLNIFSFLLSFNIIKKNNIRIVHGHMQIGIFFSYLLSRIHKIKSIGTPYSFATKSQHFAFSRFAKFIENFVYGKIDKIIFETYENKLKAKEIRGLSFPNSDVINTGVSVPENIYFFNHKKKVINLFFIGRIVKIKALDNLILAFDKLEKKIRDQVRLSIIGEGEMQDELKTLIKRKNLDKFIKMHGFVKELEPFYKKSDIFILPSDMEGLSISLLEAMSYGKACIVNNFGVPFQKDEVFIMENNKYQTIASSISYLIKNRLEIKKLGIKARDRIISDFSIKSFSKQYVDTYVDLVSQ